MSSNLISLIILIVSFLGLVFLVVKKIPALLVLTPTAVTAENSFWAKLKNTIKNIPWLKNFSPEVLLQKIISRVRVISLRADHKTASWLKTLREKTQKKKLENGEYWEDLKNSKDKK